MVRLYLVRHGEVPANTEMRYVGQRDEILTATGEAQAAALGAALTVVPLAAVYASPMARTLRTAEALAAPHDLRVIPEQRLMEQSFGAWEGLTRDEVRALGSSHAELLDRWQQDPSHTPPGGDGLSAVQARIIDLADELAARPGAGPAVLVTHVGPIKALLCAALGLSLTGCRRMFLDPATVSVVDWGPQPMLRLFNSHAHLGWGNARWLQRTLV